MENRRKSEENEMQLKAGQKAWKISKTKISQTSFAMRKFRKPVSQCENFANQNSQCENFAMRNFAMPKPNSQCENFAKPISQCEIQFRNAKTLFICPNLCEISHCEIHNHFAKFRKPISHCEIHPAKFSGLVILCN